LRGRRIAAEKSIPTAKTAAKYIESAHLLARTEQKTNGRGRIYARATGVPIYRGEMFISQL